jgi:hypothetical protein
MLDIVDGYNEQEYIIKNHKECLIVHNRVKRSVKRRLKRRNKITNIIYFQPSETSYLVILKRPFVLDIKSLLDLTNKNLEYLCSIRKHIQLFSNEYNLGTMIAFLHYPPRDEGLHIHIRPNIDNRNSILLNDVIHHLKMRGSIKHKDILKMYTVERLKPFNL